MYQFRINVIQAIYALHAKIVIRLNITAKDVRQLVELPVHLNK